VDLARLLMAQGLDRIERGAAPGRNQPGHDPTVTETATATTGSEGRGPAGITIALSTAAGWPRGRIPIVPPRRQMDEDSKRNWKRMLFRVAPIAFRTPISRVRSVTETK